MPNEFGLRYGNRYVISYRGTAVCRPDVGGFGAMNVDGYRNLVRRIDGFESITPLLADTNLATPWELSHRELEVLSLLPSGMTNPQIADALSVGVETVNTFMRRISKKLDATNRIQIVVRAIQLGLIEVQHIGMPRQEARYA